MPQRRPATRRFLATVLFTDIVASTEHAARLGDRAWRDLLEKHHAVVRRELKAFRGRELDTAGDGFFAVFETPDRAVRCAESITSAVAALGLQVRAGVHVGECEVLGGKVGGMAVVIGARIAGLAGAGQVLVSGSVRDLMTGSDRHFDGGEAQHLKGVEEAWRVYRLVPALFDGDLPSSRRSPMMPLYTRRQQRRLAIGLAAVLVAALAATSTYLLTRPDPAVAVGENAVGVIGPGREARISAAVTVGQRPTAVAGKRGTVWVANSGTDTVSRIDVRSHTSAPVSVGAAPSGVAVGAGSVWVANSGDATVSRIDPGTSRTTSIPVRAGPTGLVMAFGSVWVTHALDATVSEIDLDTNKVLQSVPVGAGPTGIAAGAGYLWVTNQSDGTVTRINPRTYETGAPVRVGNGPTGIAVADGAAWVANNLDDSLSRIDVDDLSVTSRTLVKGGGAYGVAARGRDVWVSNEHASTLMRVATRTFRLGETVRVSGAPLGLAFVGEDLWFTSAEGGRAVHLGGVLTMVGTGLAWDGDPAVLDPLVSYEMWQLAAMTHDGLVGFRRAAGVKGAGLVPNLATSLPAPTDGGRTYTFQLRKGLRYSTGEPVLAGDIRRGIERTVVHPYTAPTYFATAIVGAQDCADAARKALDAGQPRPDCDLSQGITTDDSRGTVTFHLVESTPEFVHQLALPSASAVPQDTPVDLEPGDVVPGTGPYVVRTYTPKQESADGGRGRLELVRNPRFREWSPAAQPEGYPDRIVLETGFSEADVVARLLEGRADLAWQGRPLSDVEAIENRAGTRLHTQTALWTNFVFLNTTEAPFDNKDARRAVAYALDRRAMTSRRNFLFGPVTCQIVPPNVPAYRPYCPYTVGGGDDGAWTGPDLATAVGLVRRSGTRGAKVVLAAGPHEPFQATARDVAQVLRRLGYRTTIKIGSLDDIVGSTGEWHAGLLGWFAEYPAASAFLDPLTDCGDEGLNPSRYCDPKTRDLVATALRQQVNEPGLANETWAEIDRAVVDAAALIPYGNTVRHDLVSGRVGNLQVHPVIGPLIAQMWVQ